MIRLHILGTVALEADDGTPIAPVLAQPKRLGLLSYLAVASPDGVHLRDTLLGLFWPDLDTDRARAALSQAIYFLRRSLGPSVMVTRGEGVGIDPSHLWCDVAEFNARIESASPDTRSEGLALYRGDLLPGFFLTNAVEFERWVEEERSRLRGRAAATADELCAHAEAEGRLDAAAAWARRSLAVAGPDEVRMRRLVDLLDRSGDRVGAVRAFDAMAAELERDYGLDPDPETVRLVEQIRSGRATNSRHRTPGRPGSTEETPPGSGEGSAAGSASAPPGRATEPEPRLRGPLRPFARKGVVAGAAAVLVGLTALLWAGDIRSRESEVGRVDSPPVVRLAVLPLRQLGPDPGDSYLADGLTAELVSRLSRLSRLRVLPHASVVERQRAAAGIADLRQSLEVETLLEGTVQRVDDDVRVTVQLVSTGSQEVFWSEAYDATVDELLSMQRGIAEDVALRLAIGPLSDLGDGARRTTRAAYEEYLRARALLSGDDWSDVERARSHFVLALERDSTFGPAWSGLARATIELTRGGLLAGPEAWDVARHAARQALRYDPESPEAHASLGEVHALADWDVPGALEYSERAIELDPSDVAARISFAILLRNMGRFEQALDQLRQARRLDPVRPQPLFEEATVLYLAGRAEESIVLLRGLLAREPSAAAPRTPSSRFTLPPSLPHFTLTLALVETGAFEEALAALEKADPSGSRPDALSMRAYIDAKRGRPDEARRVLGLMDRLPKRPPASDFHRAVVHVALGEYDRALELLDRATRERTRLVHLLKVEPKLEPLRGDPRFQGLVRRVGLDDLPAERGA